jgi:sec-independent protein translocase protein TatC
MKLHLARRRDLDRSHGDSDADEGLGLSLLAHLDELRRRIVYSCAAVGVGMVIGFVYINPIFDFVFRPIRSVLPQGSSLIYTQPGEAFSVYVQIALIAGVVFAAPFVMYQVWRLIAPALYQHHKWFVVPFVLLTTGGFIAGALFNHYIVFRWMIIFFGSFNSLNLAFMPRLDDVFGLYTKMLFGLGLIFQMPAVVYFLAKMGLISARFLLRNLKYAVLVIFILAAVITPTGDMTVQTLFALPMVALYLISIVIAWIVGPIASRDDESPSES